MLSSSDLFSHSVMNLSFSSVSLNDSVNFDVMRFVLFS